MHFNKSLAADYNSIIADCGSTFLNYCECDQNGSSVSSAIRARAMALIDVYYLCSIDALADAADAVILRTRANISNHWWSEELSNLKDKAYNSYLSWVDANRPKSGMIFDEYKSDKSRTDDSQSSYWLGLIYISVQEEVFAHWRHELI